MTYAGYLVVFLGGPILLLLLLHVRNGLTRPGRLGWLALLLHVGVAVGYTTPWDNYLVATRVWWYDPTRVLGVTVGWVPLEEYAFFALQTIMTGLWLLWLLSGSGMPSPRLPKSEANAIAQWWRPWPPGLAASFVFAALWAWAITVLIQGWKPATYLSLELAWFLPPLILQLVVGADILWRRRRLVATALLLPMIYLPLTDALAIASGVWTINPAQSFGLLMGGVLPVEEFIFFALTNMLIVFGMALLLEIGRELG